MRSPRLLTLVVTLVALSAAGCQLGRSSGPVPEELVTSRKFSQQGVEAIQREQWDEAQQTLAKAVQACPVNAEARRSYAETLWHAGRQRDAIGQMIEASRLSPDDALLHTRIAEMQLAVGQTEAAQAQIDQALNLDPKLPVAWAVRGRVFRAAGQPQRALADYHRALGYAPDDRPILLETAQLYRELDQPQRALAVLHNLLDTYSPGEEPQAVLVATGSAYYAVGRHDDAAQNFATALSRGPPSPELLYLLAESHAARGHTAEATAAARQALALDPRHQPSLELLQKLELAQGPAAVQR